MSWEKFKQYYLYIDALQFGIDISRIDFDDAFLKTMEPKMQAAHAAMQELESGSIANPDENRRVGHYWLRNAEMAPEKELTGSIQNCLKKIKQVTADVHSGKVKGAHGPFKNLLIIGIGGSALGPQFIADALGHPKTDNARSGT